MAQIRAFRAIRYDSQQAGPPEEVLSPPYDVISDPVRDELYQRSPWNMVRLDYGRPESGDGVEVNSYSRAARQLREWLDRGILVRESEPALYVMEETYRDDSGAARVRHGFFAAVRIESAESGIYRPHEKTLAGPREDRLCLTRACRANLSPVFSLYDDPEGLVAGPLQDRVRAQDPLYGARLQDGLGLRLWRVTDPTAIAAAARGMAGKSFFIADGHHRYETAMNYRQERLAEAPEAVDAPWNYVLMYLANMWDPGLTVFPTHRAVFGLPAFRIGGLVERLGDLFQVQEVPDGPRAVAQAVKEAGTNAENAFGILSLEPGDAWVLALRDPERRDRSYRDRVPEVLRNLDVSVLHTLILEDLLGIDLASQERQEHLRYIKGTEELFRVVRGGSFQVGFLLNPTPVDEVKAVAERGARMPQKSTFFYPKVPTGLVIHPLDDR